MLQYKRIANTIVQLTAGVNGSSRNENLGKRRLCVEKYTVLCVQTALEAADH